ncbi:uncharacterized protein N0V89_004487 [Didymosphaeria variabile]|uniref:P-loop containing nucleoside triphosphate hydrolase protein n=1 Tax=Didymosphaeria variabile TaxID=1932322 RepID=A0A9W9CCG0_9PLEO|nr:uncharacterized protein N0V89_004487 [Didymosphaeria variabile]KAJ4356454.1 hypothetical protein N0V89_004487 [Didymosphaeria variabile]
MQLLTVDEFSEYIQKNRSVQRYSSSQETKGSHPFWALPRERIDADLHGIYTKLSEILKGIPTGDRELAHLLRTIHKVPQIKRSSDLNIGLVGAQGAGKSMFLSALFDMEGISWSGADGEACTRTVVKFAYFAPNSTSTESESFYAEIKFLDNRKIEEMIREHVKDLKHYQEDVDGSDDDEPRVAQSYEQDEADKRRHDTAREIFTVLFGSEKEFMHYWMSHPTKEFMHFCKLKCLEAMKECGVPDGRNSCIRSGNDAHELMGKIKHFLADVKGVECLWPLVDHVTIRFDHELLKYGAVIIDVPGSGDTNLSRARHVEEIKDTADIVLVFADTLRIASDNSAIDTVQSCVVSRGRDKVKFVATKIDALLKNDLNNCGGETYDHIRNLVQDAGEKARASEDDGDAIKALQLGQYITYLERQLLLRYSTARAAKISSTLAGKLGGRGGADSVKVFHISANNYLEWQSKPMISFRDQPPLPPECTNIPAIRQYLFGLLSPRNFDDVAYHLYNFLPNYLQKIERAINESDRDADLGSLAQEFDRRMDELIKDHLSQAKQLFQKILENTLLKVCADTAVYQKQVDAKLCNEICKFRSPTFNKLMKNRGTLPPKASKAKGLENGCSYNRDFSNIIAPAILKWASTYVDRMQPMRQSLIELAAVMGHTVLSMLNMSSANVMVVERAKKKWKPYRMALKVKMEVLMDEFEKIHKNAVIGGTMEDGRQNCLVATITDQHFDATLDAELPQNSGCHSAKRKNQETRIKFQKRTLTERFSGPNSYFVDDVFKIFYDSSSKNIDNLLDEHFQRIRDIMEQYSASLKDELPITYKVEQGGIDVRADIARAFPKFEKMVADLQKELPNQTRAQDDGTMYLTDMDGASTLATIYAQLSRKRKQGAQDNAKAKVKKERC